MLPAPGPFQCLAVLSNYSACYPAGIIGGNTYGVAKNVTLYSVKVFSNSPSTNLTQILQAVQWVQSNAVKPAGAVTDCTSHGPGPKCKAFLPASIEQPTSDKGLLRGTQGGDAPCPEQGMPARTAVGCGQKRCPSAMPHCRCCLSVLHCTVSSTVKPANWGISNHLKPCTVQKCLIKQAVTLSSNAGLCPRTCLVTMLLKCSGCMADLWSRGPWQDSCCHRTHQCWHHGRHRLWQPKLQ